MKSKSEKESEAYRFLTLLPFLIKGKEVLQIMTLAGNEVTPEIAGCVVAGWRGLIDAIFCFFVIAEVRARRASGIPIRILTKI